MFFRKLPGKAAWSISLLILAWLIISCSGTETAVSTTTAEADHDHEAEAEMLTLPALTAVELNGEPLHVVASTTLIGDVVSQVGGEAISLNTLIAPGQDPHSYEPGAQALTAVAQADVIFINGWDLEESLARDLATIGNQALVVPISANIEPLEADEADHDEEDEHEHGAVNPHVWFDVQNVRQWTENTAQVLSALDPTNATLYQDNAAVYLTALQELETYVTEQIAAVPAEKRALVTNHDSLAYFAEAYGFEILGTVIPGKSTLAEPSASDLAALIGIMNAHDVCTIFSETTVASTLAQTVAAELDKCQSVQVVSLYTDAIGQAGSGADSYIGMFRANVEAIVNGLR